jgi:hypothetical protein
MPSISRNGSAGFEVAVVQAHLNARWPESLLRVDGSFGPTTAACVMEFQRSAGLPADGVVGPKTHTALAQGRSFITANHNLRLIAQPTRATCWAAGGRSPGHTVSISAVVSDNHTSSSGTHLLVLGPWPPRMGDVSCVDYREWITKVTTRAYRVFRH